MLEPRAASTQRNERRNQPITSTRREPSAFEAVEAVAQPRAQPKCSRCHTLGHRMTSKVCPLRYEELLQSSSAASPLASSRQTRATPAAPSSGSSGQARAERDSASCIVVRIGGTDSTVQAASSAAPSAQAGHRRQHRQRREGLVGAGPAASSSTASAPALRYDDPQTIYQRYVAGRDAWYKAQPRGSVKTNQQYRRALGLPLRYDKASYQWCLDWKQMGKRCTMPTGSRDWTKEEMMAYLDWSKAEDDRVEAQVAAEMKSNPFSSSSRRGMREIWEAAEKDGKEQQGLYSTR
jgi:hypothetical protein